MKRGMCDVSVAPKLTPRDLQPVPPIPRKTAKYSIVAAQNTTHLHARALFPCPPSTPHPPTSPSTLTTPPSTASTHLNITHETAVRSAFQSLLEHCARQVRWPLVPAHAVNPRANKRVIVDGALIDDFHLAHGYWEAKDIHDDLLRPSECSFPSPFVVS